MSVPTAGALGRCSTLDPDGVLYLRAPSLQSRPKLAAILADAGLAYDVDATIIGVQVAEERLTTLLQRFVSCLSNAESSGTMAVYCGRGRDVDAELLFSAVPLSVMYRRTELPDFIEALRHDGAQTWFQPIVAPQTPHEPFAYEALIRVRGRDRLLNGYEVFELARAADILVSVDRIARMNAVRAARLRGITQCLFLNLNPRSAHDPFYGLSSFIRRAAGAGIELSNLCFEIVESDRIWDTGHVRALVDEHRARGCKFALDDLGAGYSSLNLIHRLRPDYVKIDMDLVRGIDRDTFKQTIVRHLIDATKALAIGAIAEGVETRAEFEWLTQAGIDYMQGYYIAPPAAQPPLQPK